MVGFILLVLVAGIGVFALLVAGRIALFAGIFIIGCLGVVGLVIAGITFFLMHELLDIRHGPLMLFISAATGLTGAALLGRRVITEISQILERLRS